MGILKKEYQVSEKLNNQLIEELKKSKEASLTTDYMKIIKLLSEMEDEFKDTRKRHKRNALTVGQERFAVALLLMGNSYRSVSRKLGVDYKVIIRIEDYYLNIRESHLN